GATRATRGLRGRRLALRRFCILVGFGLGLGVLVGLGLGLRLLLVGADEVALVLLVGLEVGFVPAGALQTEHGRRNQFLEATLATRRALAERRVGDLLHHLGVELAGLTLVLVERHGWREKAGVDRDYKRAGPPRAWLRRGRPCARRAWRT